MRAIDADKVVKWSYSEPRYSDSVNDRTDLRDFLLSLPTLSPDDLPPVGDWVKDRTEIYCPACGQRFTDEVMCCDIYGWPWMFCPKCGEKMEVSDDA